MVRVLSQWIIKQFALWRAEPTGLAEQPYHKLRFYFTKLTYCFGDWVAPIVPDSERECQVLSDYIIER